MGVLGYRWRQIKRRWAERKLVVVRHPQLPGEVARISGAAVPYFEQQGWQRS